MDINFSVQYGPIQADIRASEDEPYREELLEVLKIIEEYEERLADTDCTPEESATSTSQSDLRGSWATSQESPSEESNPDTSSRDSPLNAISRKTGIDLDQLVHVLYVDPEEGDPPEILVDEYDMFGSARKAKQKSAALILIYLWQECYEMDEIHSTELKDAIAGCGIDPSSLFHIYDGHFRKSGSQNREISLTRKGELQAQEEIESLVSHHVEENSD